MPSDNIALTTVLSRSPTLVHSEVDGEILMMSIDTGRYYGLGEVGASIWLLLDEPVSVRVVCDRLMDEYRIDRQRCEQEVLAFSQDLASEGLVVVDAA